ncbi:MAG TPA: radical SAM protein [Clostridia bacterium]
MCGICPRNCKVNRIKNKGYCRVHALPVVAKACLHMWEEPCISGSRGSGTVFFSGCNLKCVYCQNHDISQECFGKEVPTSHLGQIFLRLKDKGAHNINLVNPTHYTDAIKECLDTINGLDIPIVYNSNGYESITTLRSLEGYVNVYLPDFKYIDNETALKYSNAENYFEIAAQAITEMYRQVGPPVLDEEGIIKKGLIIRHLILPGMASMSIKILDFIKENLPGAAVSLMSQYTPYYRCEEFPEINRRITRREYEKVVNHFLKLDFENGYIQERDSASEKYIPDFNLEGI